MPIQRHRTKWLVTVHRAAANPGYTRIRRIADTLEDATTLEASINEALEVFGKYPVEEGDRPLRHKATHYVHATTIRRTTKASGTLREATTIALDTHWHGKRYHRVVRYAALRMVDFFENLGCPDLDDITSPDIDAFVADLQKRKLSPSSMNSALGALRVINRIALARIPPLATITLPIPHIKGRRVEKWWLRPDDHAKVVAALRSPTDGSLVTDPAFADLIDIICYQGLRVEEAMRLEARMFTGLDAEEPWLQVPGTKTQGAQNSIPIYPEAIEPIRTAIARAQRNRWGRLFPYKERQVWDRWNDVRDFLHVRHISTSTMKSLRRTFAWYANSKGMPTSTLQKVLRHRGIATTAGYLDLVGDSSLKDSRRYFSEDSTPKTPVEAAKESMGSNIGAIIQAYAQTPGVTPEEVARFAKELMV